MPPAAEYFVGTINGELVCHVAVCPFFTAGAYRSTRLVVMPEWQGAGVGTKFLEWVCKYHREGNGRCQKKYPTFFHTSHPQLIAYMKRSKLWVQTSQMLTVGNMGNLNEFVKVGSHKINSGKTMASSRNGMGLVNSGYGGHFRAVQGFKYVGGINEN
jgi:tRNA(Met) C34 N-acetyltransferase TmcA